MRPARIPRAVLQRKEPKARPQVRSANHLAYIRALPCIVCGRAPSEAAHIRQGTDAAAGVKPGDRYTLPLCTIHHAEQHRVGELSFYAALEIDPTGLANRLWTVSGDIPSGIRIVFRSRQLIDQHILLKRYTTPTRGTSDHESAKDSCYESPRADARRKGGAL